MTLILNSKLVFSFIMQINSEIQWNINFGKPTVNEICSKWFNGVCKVGPKLMLTKTCQDITSVHRKLVALKEKNVFCKLLSKHWFYLILQLARMQNGIEIIKGKSFPSNYLVRKFLSYYLPLTFSLKKDHFSEWQITHIKTLIFQTIISVKYFIWLVTDFK